MNCSPAPPPPPPHYRPSPSPAGLIRNTTYRIFNPNNGRSPARSSCSYLKKRFLLVRFMRLLPPPRPAAAAASVVGIPRLIRLIAPLNRSIIAGRSPPPPFPRLALHFPLVAFAGLQQDCSSAGLPFRSCQGFSLSFFLPPSLCLFFLSLFFSPPRQKSWLPTWGRRAKLARK